MSVKDDVALLKKIPLFSTVDDSQLNVLAFAVERLRVDAGDTLFYDGEHGTGAFVIVKGTVSVTRPTPAGDAEVEVGPGALIGEQVMFAEIPHRSTARATSNVEAFKISRELFYRVAEEFPDLAAHAIRAVNEKLNATLSDLGRVARDM